jgi:hypothetical protein
MTRVVAHRRQDTASQGENTDGSSGIAGRGTAAD